MIYKVCALGIIAAILFVMMQNEKKEYAITILICAGVMILMLVFPYLSSTVKTIQDFLALSQIADTHILTIFKIISISYIAQFASDICNDSGAKSIATKIELGAKFFIMYLSVPIFVTLFEYINGILQ